MSALLSIRNLTVSFHTSAGIFSAVENFSLDISPGEILSVVGESGSGKSVAMLAFMGLLGKNALIQAEAMTFEGKDWLNLSAGERRRLMGSRIGMIFQEPQTSLNPCFRVGDQIAEKIALYGEKSGKNVKSQVLELFEKVGITDAASRYKAFPHQFSGGMNQRVMIAMAIACNPRLIIADEPTTALDVTIQAQILDLLRSLQAEKKMGLILITHNMGIVAETAHRVLVQYAGSKVEEGPCQDVLNRPRHPYTQGLLDSLPERNTGEFLHIIPGNIPSIQHKPPGCIFHPRCSYAKDMCKTEPPVPFSDGPAFYRCFFPLNEPKPETHE